jgi:SAM-dependent methyltransferase
VYTQAATLPMPFDQQYYERFYANPRTAVITAGENRRRAEMIAAGVKYLEVPVRTILDAGCGMGLLRAPLKKAFPRAEYVGLEYSGYLCERYGWHHGSVATWRTRQRFELVIYYDVLQYLDERAAARAIANLARWCRGVLYFSALTREDWRDNCDQSKTDKVPGLRSGRWYRQALQKHFDPLGCGLWIKRGAPLSAWELDKGARV